MGGGVSHELQGFFFCVVFSITNAPSDSLTASRSDTPPPLLLRKLTSLMHYSHPSLKTFFPQLFLPPPASPSSLLITNHRCHFGKKQRQMRRNCVSSANRKEASLTVEVAMSTGTPCCVSHYSSPPSLPPTAPPQKRNTHSQQKSVLSLAVAQLSCCAGAERFQVSTKLHQNNLAHSLYFTSAMK